MERMMKEYLRGDVFWADLGEKSKDTKDSEQGGVRPVIIIQNNVGNRYSPTVIVSAITSQLNKTKIPTHVGLDWEYIGLSSESVVMLEQIRTLDKRKLLQRIGKASEKDMKRIDIAASVSLELREIEDRVQKTINNKIKRIKLKNYQIEYGIRNDVNSEKYFNSLFNERDALIQDLKYYCLEKGLDYKNFLKGNDSKDIKNNIRKVC